LGPRNQLILVIFFGVVGAILVVLGLLLFSFGFTYAYGLFMLGVLCLITSLVLGYVWGFVFGEFGLPPINA
jgi:hypothetical protein